MLLGTAKILQEYADELPTDILLIFQPAEEGPGLGGAVKMVPQIQNTGIADKIVAAFGQHVSNDYPAPLIPLTSHSSGKAATPGVPTSASTRSLPGQNL